MAAVNGPEQGEEVEPGLYVLVDPTGRLAHELHDFIASLGSARRSHDGPAAQTLELVPDPPRPRSRLERLTRRELEILEQVAQRRSNSEIARHLWISQDTVRFHLRNAYRKLSVHNRRDALEAAERRGLLQTPAHDR